MATHVEGQVAHRPKGPAAKDRRARRKNGHAARTRSARARRKRPTVGELERVIESLEARLAQLTSGGHIRSTVSGATNQVGRVVTQASHHMGEAVADTLTDVAAKFRSGATSVTGAARMGTGAMRKIGSELERRPFMTVAVALGIGFLAGLAGRQDDAA